MIGKLRGIIENLDSEFILLDVNGVGYQVYCSVKTIHNLKIGQNCSLYIETQVREDSIKLFGFTNADEKEVFLLLQSVNGIGSKVSLSILSHMTCSELHHAISVRNKEIFTTIPGIGAKTAERIIVELKGKKLFSQPAIYSHEAIPHDAHDAISALTSLGILRNEAMLYVEKIVAKTPDAKIDDIIKQALILRSKQ
jgi:Holliday junction DNA helicase RuvA